MAQWCVPASSPFRRPRAARHHDKSYSSHAFSYPGSAHRPSVHNAEPLFHTALPLTALQRVCQVPPRRALFPVLEHRVQQLPLPCTHLHPRQPHRTPVYLTTHEACRSTQPTAHSTRRRTRARTPRLRAASPSTSGRQLHRQAQARCCADSLWTAWPPM